MASKTLLGRRKYLAKLSDKQAPCAFCNRIVDDETTYGKLYSIGDIHCHYFCALLSCCLVQNGKDEEGLFGFLYPDIIAEIDRSKKHKCSYCSKGGATLGCSVAQCRKQFHLPCGREKNAVSLFYGNYKTFCRDHAPKQKIPNTIMNKAVLRRRKANKIKQNKSNTDNKEHSDEIDTVCVICYEKVDGFPTLNTFWPPCCARDAWFHRNCIERMALNAGVHYLKCPLCNDKEYFHKAVLEQGYYVPDRDAAWELEQNAYADIYERPSVCCMEECKCPNGREFDAESGQWDIQLCVLCGSAGSHLACGKSHVHVCDSCAQASPDMEGLEEIIKVSLPIQNQSSRTRQSGPIMPSRMSLRRTKGRINIITASTSRERLPENNQISTTEQSRQELNLKTPKERQTESNERNALNKMSTPIKLIEKVMVERYNTRSLTNFDKILNEVIDKFRKPRPMVEKRKIVQNVLEDFLMNNNNMTKESCKTKEDLREWNSPKKCPLEETVKSEINEISPKIETQVEFQDITTTEQTTPIKNAILNEDVLIIQETPKLKKINIQNDSMEISEHDQIINVDLVGLKNLDSILDSDKQKCLKFNPFEGVIEKNTDIDVESFKNQYLNEVERKFDSNIKENDDKNVNSFRKNPPKRKLTSRTSVASKRRKTTKMVENKSVDNKTEVSIRNRNINLKIKWKNEELNLKISNMKKRNKRRKKRRVLKQYVLSPQLDSNEIMSRPNSDVTLIKPKKIKMEKSSDNLKQTSISSFFKLKFNGE